MVPSLERQCIPNKKLKYINNGNGKFCQSWGNGPIHLILYAYFVHHIQTFGCYTCQQSRETHWHFLLHCTVVVDIWNMFIFSFWTKLGDAYPMWWSSWRYGRSIRNIWKLISACYLLLCLERKEETMFQWNTIQATPLRLVWRLPWHFFGLQAPYL